MIIKNWEFSRLSRTFSGPSHPDNWGLISIGFLKCIYSIFPPHFYLNSQQCAFLCFTCWWIRVGLHLEKIHLHFGLKMEKTAGIETCHHSFYHTVRNNLRIFALHFETVSQDEGKRVFFKPFFKVRYLSLSSLYTKRKINGLIKVIEKLKIWLIQFVIYFE